LGFFQKLIWLPQKDVKYGGETVKGVQRMLPSTDKVRVLNEVNSWNMIPGSGDFFVTKEPLFDHFICGG
jgi:hypothetical protein